MAALVRSLTKVFRTGFTSSPSSSPNFPRFNLISCRGIASKLFVKGLSFYTTDKALAEGFSEYGQVVEAKVVFDQATEKSKGFGFVTFASEDEALKAMTEMDGRALQGRVITVDVAKPRYQSGRETPIARGPPTPSPVTDNYVLRSDG